MAEKPLPLTPREAASGLLGSLSLTFWIFLLVSSAILPLSQMEISLLYDGRH